jgi:phospholipid/cholesterol/gamma-HCH transport system substrate-binding protein
MKTEFMVGAFTLVVFVLLALLTFKVGEFKFGRETGYKVYVFFDNTAGLDPDSNVKIAGVDAGKVEKIELFAGKARVMIRVNEDITLYQDATARIKSIGLLGDKFLELTTGSRPPALQGGNTIKDAKSVAEIDDLVRNITELSVSVGELVADIRDPEVKSSIKQTLFNMRDLTADLKDLIATNRGQIDNIVDRMESVVAQLDMTIQETREPLNTGMAKLNESMDDLKDMTTALKDTVDEARPRIANITEKAENTFSSFEDIANRIESGEGTLGKLVTDEALYNSVTDAASSISNTLGRIERFRAFLTFKGDYLFEEDEGKGYFNLVLQPRRERYYVLGIVTDPIGMEDEEKIITNGSTTTVTTVEEKLEFTLQVAHRFENVAVRLGLMETTFGVGADYFMLDDKLVLTADMWDFGEDEEDADDPHLRIGADYFVFKGLFLSGGLDNILNENRRGFYLGGGVRFEDEDFKALLGTLPSVPD